jgi:methyltransferase (TIGR00027 family)
VKKKMSFENPDKEGLASTACWIAAIRAHESEHADRLFEDPWAALLAGQAGQTWLDRMEVIEARLERMSKDYRIAIHWGKPGQEWGSPKLRFETTIPQHTAKRDQEALTEIGVVIRTKFFDDFLLHALAEYPIRQVVMLAAGMDTRGFRLTLPAETRLFELDQPELLAQKEELLSSASASATCWRRTIGIDFIKEHWPEALLRAGFKPRQPTVWLIEGLLPYLAESTIPHLLNIVTALSAPDSQLAFTAINREMLTSPSTQLWVKAMEEAGVPWLSAMDKPETLLAKRGWVPTVVQPGEEGANFGRWSHPVVPRSVPAVPRSWLVTAVRQAR